MRKLSHFVLKYSNTGGEFKENEQKWNNHLGLACSQIETKPPALKGPPIHSILKPKARCLLRPLLNQSNSLAHVR
jgi:hypothetical protein